MNISQDMLIKKLRSGYKIFTKVGNIIQLDIDDTTDIQIIDANTITIDSIHTVKLIGLIHPQDDDKIILIDSIKQPKPKVNKKTKIKIVRMSKYYHDVDHILCTYCILKAIETYGNKNVEIVTFDYQEYERGSISYLGDDDQHVLFLGLNRRTYPELIYGKCISEVKYNFRIHKYAESILKKLQSVGIKPYISINNEKDKLCKLINFNYDNNNYTLSSYLFNYTINLSIDVVIKKLQQKNNKLLTPLKAYFNTKDEVKLEDVTCLQEDITKVKQVNMKALDHYVFAKDLLKKKHEDVFLIDSKICRSYNVTYYNIRSCQCVLRYECPSAIIILYRNEELDVYITNNTKLNYDDILSKVKTAILDYSKIKKVSIYLDT